MDYYKTLGVEKNSTPDDIKKAYRKLASNASLYTNIEGNFVYMRAKIEDFSYGIVNFVKLSY